MFSAAVRPFARSIPRSLPLRSLSSRAAPKSRWGPTSTVVALASLTAVGFAATSERRTVWNEGYGTQPTKESPKRHEYDEDLKNVNRHQVAAQEGKAPDSPLHNTNSGVTSTSIAPPPPTPSTIEKKAEEAEESSEDSASQGAFNEETGEINWDCPCLGGMAHGPCGEQFRAAFSCFVFSEKEPKGIDCVELFKNMQDCFREHPDIYGEEIEDDEAAQAELSSPESSPSSDSSAAPATPTKTPPENSPILEQTQANNPSKGVKTI